MYNHGKREHGNSEVEKQLDQATAKLVKVKQEHSDETDVMKAAIFKLLPLLPTIDLTESDVEDYQDVIDEDDEDVEFDMTTSIESPSDLSNNIHHDEAAIRESADTNQNVSSTSTVPINSSSSTGKKQNLNDQGNENVDILVSIVHVLI